MINYKALVATYWQAFDKRRYREACELLNDSCSCEWTCTNEVFSKEAFILANESYPGKWYTKMKESFLAGNQVITLTHIYSENKEDAYYATTVFTFNESQVVTLKEYFSPIEEKPEWR